MNKQTKTREELREELEEAFCLLCEKFALLQSDWSDEDAETLATNAWSLEGLESDCNKVADLAGALAMEIDPEIADKI